VRFVTRKGEPAWTFYGRQECGCCEEAANLLLLLLDGKPITLRMVDLHGPEEAPASIHRLPALMDAHGLVVWQGSFDSRATESAWKVAQPRPSRDGGFVHEEHAAQLVPNGLQ